MEQTTGAAFAGGLVGGAVMMTLLVGFVMWVLLVVARWRMFTKAGVPGWKSIIPIYSEYVLYKIVWNTRSFWFFCGATLLTMLFTALSGQYAMLPSGEMVYVGGGNFIFGALTFVASIVVMFYSVMCAVKTAMAFGKGAVFAIGLVLLPNVFTMILAFGSAKYLGPQE